MNRVPKTSSSPHVNMVKVFRYDPGCPSRGRTKSGSLSSQRQYRTRKRLEDQRNLNDTIKVSSPILFHNIKVDEMNNSLKLDRLAQESGASGIEGSKTRQNPLVIKTDPKYNNSHLEMSVSSRKLNDFTSSRNRKLTFVPSISNRSPFAEQRSGKLSNQGDMKSSKELRTLRDDFLELAGPSMTNSHPDKRLHSGPEGRNSSGLTENSLTNLPFLGRKFSSDVRLKLSKKNARLQPIQGYSTCTFRVKINNDRRGLEHKGYGS